MCQSIRRRSASKSMLSSSAHWRDEGDDAANYRFHRSVSLGIAGFYSEVVKEAGAWALQGGCGPAWRAAPVPRCRVRELTRIGALAGLLQRVPGGLREWHFAHGGDALDETGRVLPGSHLHRPPRAGGREPHPAVRRGGAGSRGWRAGPRSAGRPRRFHTAASLPARCSQSARAREGATGSGSRPRHRSGGRAGARALLQVGHLHLGQAAQGIHGRVIAIQGRHAATAQREPAHMPPGTRKPRPALGCLVPGMTEALHPWRGRQRIPVAGHGRVRRWVRSGCPASCPGWQQSPVLSASTMKFISPSATLVPAEHAGEVEVLSHQAIHVGGGLDLHHAQAGVRRDEREALGQRHVRSWWS